MATTSEEIRLIVKTELDKATKDLKKFNDGLGDSTTRGAKATAGFKKMKVGILAAAAAIGAIAVAIGKTVKAASELEEVQGKFNSVFSDSPEVLADANEAVLELQESYILSEREARSYLSTIQDMLVPMGLVPSKALDMSTGIVKLAADLASMNDVPVSEAMDKIQSGLVGMGRPMLEWGVQINEATLKAEAFRLKLSDGKTVLDGATKAQAAFSIMTRESSKAMGDVVRTADSWANRQKQLNVTLEDSKAAMGAPIIAAMKEYQDAMRITRGEVIAAARDTGKFVAAIIRGTMEMDKFAQKISDKVLTAVSDSAAHFSAGARQALNYAKAIGSVLGKSVKGAFSFDTKPKSFAEDLAEIKNKLKGYNKEAIKSTGVAQELNKQIFGQIDSTGKLKKNFFDMTDQSQKLGLSNKKTTKEVKKQTKAFEDSGDAARRAAEAAKKAAAEKAAAEKKAHQDMIQGIKNVMSFTGSALGEISSLYSQHAENKITLLNRERDERLEAVEEDMQQELERAGVAEETAAEQAEKKITDLQLQLAAASTVEDRARIQNQIKEQKDAVKRAQIIEKFNKQKAAIEEAAAAKERKLKRKAAEMQRNLSIAQTLLETPLAAMRAFSSAMVLPPGVNVAVGTTLAGIATALGAAKLAVIKSTPLPEAAEGGIIPGSQGGTPLIAGEGGRSEAIIPLENDDALENAGIGGGTTVNIYIENAFADEDFPTELAVKIDQALTKLGQDENLRLGSVI